MGSYGYCCQNNILSKYGYWLTIYTCLASLSKKSHKKTAYAVDIV